MDSRSADSTSWVTAGSDEDVLDETLEVKPEGGATSGLRQLFDMGLVDRVVPLEDEAPAAARMREHSPLALR